MKQIISIALVLISATSFAQNKYYDVQRIDSLYGKFTSGSSTDSVVTVNALGKFYKRNASAFGISGITADNGLTASTSTNVQLGGTLLKNTTIDATSLYQLSITGSIIPATGYVMKVSSSNATGGRALGAEAVGSGTAVFATGVSGYAVYGTSTVGTGVYGDATSGNGVVGISNTGLGSIFEVIPNSTNTVVAISQFHRLSNGTAANGIGGSIDLLTQTTAGFGQISNQLISKWTDATNATRTSQFIITGVDAGTTRNLMTADGNGAITMPGQGNPSTTLTVNASSGAGIQSLSTGAVGIVGYSENTYGIESVSNLSSTNTVAGTFYIQRRSTGTAANGIGASLDFSVDNTGGAGDLSNKLISKWANATFATRTSEFSITGVTSASAETWVTVGQSGYLQIRYMTATEASAITAANGMIVCVSSTNGTFTSTGFWGYSGGAWAKF